MNTTEITLLIFDSQENFNKLEVQRQYGGKILFKNLICFSDEKEFVDSINSLDNQDKFVIVCHVNYEDFSGFLDFRNTGIKKKYNLEGRINYVSSGDSGEAMKELYRRYGYSAGVILYSELISSIEREEIKSITKKDLEITEDVDVKSKVEIFLSHSSLDKDVVERFRDLVLIQGLKFDSDLIKFTSDEATGIAGGVDIPTDLRNHLNNNTGLFIQFLSDNYGKSRVCLNEEGAGWVLVDDLMFIPIFLKGYNHSALSWIKGHSKGIKIDDKTSLLNIYDNRKEFFQGNINVAMFNKKVDEFIASL